MVESTVPSSSMRPRVGRVMPEIQFNSVLLPAPFGPINPTIDPASSAKVTSVRGWMPPKSTATFWIAGRDISSLPRHAARHPPQPLRNEHHDDDQQQAEHQA